MRKIITVLGLGYIGLPTALLLARAGHKVYGYDVNKNRIKILQKKVLPFEEKGLRELFSQVQPMNTFTPINELNRSDFYIIAVPTPQINKSADLTFVNNAINMIKSILKDGDTIILESTVGPTDCEKKIIPRLKVPKKLIHFVHCPERAIPGNTLYEMTHNARIIGGHTKTAAEKVKNLYQTFVKGKIYTTSTTVAAACKVMENTYRDINIAYANELAKIAQELNFNIWEAIELANKHPRVNIHYPGPGVGGHCIAIDPWFFVGESKQARLIRTAREINDNMPKFVALQVEKIIKKYSLKAVRIGLLGYAYKKNVDDARETPVESIIKILEKKYSILLNDPHIKNGSREITHLEKVLKNCSLIILATDHDEYKKIDFSRYPHIPCVFDTRNFFTKKNINKSRTILITLGKNNL